MHISAFGGHPVLPGYMIIQMQERVTANIRSVHQLLFVIPTAAALFVSKLSGHRCSRTHSRLGVLCRQCLQASASIYATYFGSFAVWLKREKALGT